MTQSARRASQFDREGKAGGNSGGKTEEQTKAKPVADAENKGIGYGAGEQAKRTVLSAEQVVGEIKATENIKTGAGNTDGGDRMVVHGKIVERVFCGWMPRCGEAGKRTRWPQRSCKRLHPIGE